MAKNDVVLLDGIVEERVAEQHPSAQPDEVFEFLAFEQILKDYDLSKEELEAGWVDGPNDGGIDGFFTFVNGHLLTDGESFVWPRKNASIDVNVLTCKHHDTFKQAPINSIFATAQELFDFGRDPSAIAGRYSPDLLRARGLLQLAYRRLSSILPTVRLKFSYVSRGDTHDIGENVRTRAEQLTEQVAALFSSCEVTFDFVGAAELLQLYRRMQSFSLELPFVECLCGRTDGYVLLARLDHYCRFVTDDNGSLRRYLFDSNVRDYLADTRVNEDILDSLKAPGTEFWWLNNGITILATGATIVGKTIQLQNIQIVNGLQTTESIFNYFGGGGQREDARSLLVKVIVSSDAMVRDRIIRATNNQNPVELASLHATEKIQRDIEEILERNEWYYERRKNYYRNIGKPASRFVTPLYIAGGFVSLVLKNPAVGARLKQRFMRNPSSYAAVFSSAVPIEVWPAIVGTMKAVEEQLSRIRIVKGESGERFLAQLARPRYPDSDRPGCRQLRLFNVRPHCA